MTCSTNPSVGARDVAEAVPSPLRYDVPGSRIRIERLLHLFDIGTPGKRPKVVRDRLYGCADRGDCRPKLRAGAAKVRAPVRHLRLVSEVNSGEIVRQQVLIAPALGEVARNLVAGHRSCSSLQCWLAVT